MLAQRIGVGLGNVREPHQRAGMCAQRKQIGPELVMQFARNFLALDILQRNRAFGELAACPPRRLPSVAARWFSLVQIAASSGAPPGSTRAS